MSAVPNQFEYNVRNLDKAITQASYISRATNGSVFNANNTIQFNLLNNASTYLVPESMFLQGTIKITCAEASTVLGIPGYSAFNRLDTFANSANIESINSYGAICQQLIHSKLNTAQKVSMSEAFGTSFDSDGSFVATDSNETVAATEKIINFSVPINNVLTNCTKYVPLDMAQMILYLTVDSAENFTCVSADGSTPNVTAFTLENMEIHYKAITVPAYLDAMIKSQVDGAKELTLKSSSYSVTLAQLAANSSGSQAYSFANSLTSIKSLMVAFCRTDRFRYNAAYKISDVGQLNYIVSGKNYPQTPLNLQRSGHLLEYLESVHGINVSPTSVNHSLNVNNALLPNAAFAAAQLKNLPKTYYGCNVESLAGNQLVMSGISSQNSNIELRFSIDNVAPNVNLNLMQTFLYDLVIKYNPSTGVFYTMR